MPSIEGVTYEKRKWWRRRKTLVDDEERTSPEEVTEMTCVATDCAYHGENPGERLVLFSPACPDCEDIQEHCSCGFQWEELDFDQIDFLYDLDIV